jgi:hypothetical protein
MLRRYLPVALSFLAYILVAVSAAMYDLRLVPLVVGLAALYEAREASG